jgi:hypothetical protein
VVREGLGEGGEMTQTLYAHMNKKKILVIILIFILESLSQFIYTLKILNNTTKLPSEKDMPITYKNA